MWILLLQPKAIERNGRLKTYKKGTQVNVGRMDALCWIQEGAAKAIDAYVPALDVPQDAGIVAVRGKANLESIVRNMQIVEGPPPRIEFGRTLIWDLAFIRPDLLACAWQILEHWQAAVPLWSYTELACHVGDNADRERTKEVIRDLRVPLYDNRMIFVQRCADTLALIDEYNKELAFGGDGRLAFLRAYYRVKPVLCALPTVWTGRER